ncbi:hypothetical protein ACFWHT_04765 [Microbacterium sp. NPDC058342]|uniref:hypothetical protein n=1 Tax=Microbacterium sp. NPDC058342 TaxID=3346454 RepID=UPI00365B0AC0
MADKQAPETTETPVLTAPPRLQVIGQDSPAGMCVDGRCTLPPAGPGGAAR